MVWALYEDPAQGLVKNAALEQDKIRDMLVKQNTDKGSNVTGFPSEDPPAVDNIEDFLK
jgi:hypothetical protein